MMKENFATVFDRQPLFPGNSCFPLSPVGIKNPEQSNTESGYGSGDEKMKNDQLNKIFDVIGTPHSPEDLSFI